MFTYTCSLQVKISEKVSAATFLTHAYCTVSWLDVEGLNIKVGANSEVGAQPLRASNVCDLCDIIAAVIYEVGQCKHVEF